MYPDFSSHRWAPLNICQVIPLRCWGIPLLTRAFTVPHFVTGPEFHLTRILSQVDHRSSSAVVLTPTQLSSSSSSISVTSVFKLELLNSKYINQMTPRQQQERCQRAWWETHRSNSCLFLFSTLPIQVVQSWKYPDTVFLLLSLPGPLVDLLSCTFSPLTESSISEGMSDCQPPCTSSVIDGVTDIHGVEYFRYFLLNFLQISRCCDLLWNVSIRLRLSQFPLTDSCRGWRGDGGWLSYWGVAAVIRSPGLTVLLYQTNHQNKREQGGCLMTIY